MSEYPIIPLFPLDGHHIMREMLPPERQKGFMHWQMRFGAGILMMLIFGPRLLGVITRRPVVFDPLDIYLAYVVLPILSLLGI